MNKYLKYLLLPLFFNFVMSTYASDDDKTTKAMMELAKEAAEIKEAKKKVEEDLNSLKKEKGSLEKRIKSLQSDSAKLQKENEKLTRKNSELAEELKNNGNNKKAIEQPLKAQISELQNKVDSLNQLLADKDNLQQQNLESREQELLAGNSIAIDSLENELTMLRNENSQLLQDKEALEASNKRKDDHLKELEIFEAQYLATLATSFDSDWASKPYSAMNADDLKELVEMCNKFASKDKRIEESLVNFSKLNEELNAYVTASFLYNTPFNGLKVNDALISLEKAEKNATPEHQKELENMAQSLRDYRSGIMVFQYIIERVDEKADEFNNHAASINAVKEELEKYEKDTEIIQSHPWLAQKYKEYLQEINKNCKEQGPARNAIMDLKTN